MQKYQTNPPNCCEPFNSTFAMLVTFSLAAGVGASLIAKELVIVLLGTQLAASNAFRSIVGHTCRVLVRRREHEAILYGHSSGKIILAMPHGYVAILIPAIVITAHTANAEAVALARTATTVFFSMGMLGALVFAGALDLKDLVNLFWRPVVATGVMALCVWLVDLSAPAIIVLGLRVMIGTIAFLGTLTLLWNVSGRPNGSKSAIFRLFTYWFSLERKTS